MLTLKQAIAKMKGTDTPEMWKEMLIPYLYQIAQDIITHKVSELNDEMRGVVRTVVDETVNDLLVGELKPKFRGEKGDKPIPGVDYTIPKDGKDAPTIEEILSKIPKPKDGYTPIKNKDYFDGKDGHTPIKGVDYSDGEKGKDGTEIEPEDIAKKLNTLRNALNLSVIAGLEDKLSNIMRSVREKSGGSGGGGGMGNVQHERFNTTSATTTVTTKYSIAGGGFAIWAYYQGQEIFRGTAYTVGNDHKTLTLLFTPEDSTVIDITYMRG